MKRKLKEIIARGLVNRGRSHPDGIEILESKHVDLSLRYPNDSTFFYGGDEEGNAFICRMALRGPHRRPEAWFDFYINGAGYLGLRDIPGPEGDGFSLGSLSWKPRVIGREWLITYEGPLHDDAGKRHDARVELLFKGSHDVYDFAGSSDRGLIARSMAAEKWTREFFGKLKELSQVHYEQTGTMSGFIEYGGKRRDFNFRALRDHSYGSRSWESWDRHYWISGIADDGYRWTVTTIRYDFIDRLSAGFVITLDGAVDPIVDCTDLETISRDAAWPSEGTVDIMTGSGKRHVLEFKRPGYFPYLMDDTYWMLEGIGRYRFNGVKGLGMVEFGFTRGRYDVGTLR